MVVTDEADYAGAAQHSGTLIVIEVDQADKDVAREQRFVDGDDSIRPSACGEEPAVGSARCASRPVGELWLSRGGCASGSRTSKGARDVHRTGARRRRAIPRYG